MKNMRFIIAVCIVFAYIPVCLADEKPWSDEAELSFVQTSGNTEVTSASGSNLLTYQFTDRAKGSWKLAALYGETDGEKNAESYLNELRFDYLFTEKFYAYILGWWLKDEFAGFKSQYYAGPGVGYGFLDGPKHYLSAEAGLSYTSDEYTNDTKKDYGGSRLFGKYEYAFTEKNRLSQSLEYLYDFNDSENYKLISESAAKSALSDSLSLKASYLVTYYNKPVAGTSEDTDTRLSVTLVISF